MRSKYFTALALIFLGTNLFTYATTRYWTTNHVLTRASEHTAEIMDRQRAGQLRPDQPPDRLILSAIGNAGGMYHWWNEGLLYWGAAGVLIISGFLVTKLDSRKDVATS
jgi:hypothetical protein